MKSAAALMLAATAATTVGVTGAQAAGSGDGLNRGCPERAVCIYPGDDFNNDRPSHRLGFGTHNLRNQFGSHLILNNIRRGAGLDNNTFARVLTCTGFNGTGSCRALPDPDVNIVNLTPINSIVVAPRRASGQEPR